MGPKKLAKENESEVLKPARVLRARPQVVSTHVEVDDNLPVKEKKARAKKKPNTDNLNPEKAKAPPKPKKVAAKGHKLPDPIKPGEIFIDSAKKSWRVGKSLGSGGFGEVYSATDDVNDNKVDGYKYVMKVEYSTGPLFVEQHFYIRCAKPEHLHAYKKEKKLKTLGIPTFYAMKGQQEHSGNVYRFIIISKFGQDLQRILDEHKKFSIKNTLTIGCSLLEALEYIHHSGYVHADLKPANVLLGVDSSQAVVNIVDFGLATKYMDTENNHKDHIVEKKAAHNGTLIYTSCVAHRGAVTTSRICDVEILAYNLLHLVTGSLPWQPLEKTPDKVLQMKEALLKDPKTFLSTHYDVPVHDVFMDLFKYISVAKFDTIPDYDKLKTMFTKALQKAGHKFDGKLNFNEKEETRGETENSKKKAVAKKKAPAKKVVVTDDIDSSDHEEDAVLLDEEALRYVNTSRRKVKENVEEHKAEELNEKVTKKNVKENKIGIPTQAMLDVMNSKKNKPDAVERKKKVEEVPIVNIESPETSKKKLVVKKNKKVETLPAESDVPKDKPVARKNKKVESASAEPEEKSVPKKAKKAISKNEPASDIPTPAMLEYMNKKKVYLNSKKKQDNVGKRKEKDEDLEQDLSSGDEEQPSEKKMKENKEACVEPEQHELNKILELPEEEHALNETYTVIAPAKKRGKK